MHALPVRRLSADDTVAEFNIAKSSGHESCDTKTHRHDSWVNLSLSNDSPQVRKFVLLPAEFSIAGGELGPTLKIKRFAVEKKWENHHSILNNSWPWIKWSVDFKFEFDSETKSWFIIIISFNFLTLYHNFHFHIAYII